MALDDGIDQHAIFQKQRESGLTHLDKSGLSSATISNCKPGKYRAGIGIGRSVARIRGRTMRSNQRAIKERRQVSC